MTILISNYIFTACGICAYRNANFPKHDFVRKRYLPDFVFVWSGACVLYLPRLLLAFSFSHFLHFGGIFRDVGNFGHFADLLPNFWHILNSYPILSDLQFYFLDLCAIAMMTDSVGLMSWIIIGYPATCRQICALIIPNVQNKSHRYATLSRYHIQRANIALDYFRPIRMVPPSKLNPDTNVPPYHMLPW